MLFPSIPFVTGIYNMLLPTIPIVIGYLVTYFLYRKGFIKKSVHVNIWNLIICCAFIISAGAGFILLVLLELKIISQVSLLTSPINLTLLYWHTEIGLTLVLVAILHHHSYLKTSNKTSINKGLE